MLFQLVGNTNLNDALGKQLKTIIIDESIKFN